LKHEADVSVEDTAPLEKVLLRVGGRASSGLSKGKVVQHARGKHFSLSGVVRA
jgi:hypothetical protein